MPKDATLESISVSVRERLADDKPIRRTLPGYGRLHIDRQLPFLCVYRKPGSHEDAGTDRLVTGEASYLVASSEAKVRSGVEQLTRAVVETLTGVFGAFLLVEIWAVESADSFELDEDAYVPRPAVRIRASRDERAAGVVENLAKWLRKIRYAKQSMVVEEAVGAKRYPPGTRPLIPKALADQLGCVHIGLEVKPYYRDPTTGEVFPAVLTRFRRGLGRALKHAFFEFARTQTPLRPPHYHALGRRAMAKAVWEVDARLGEISTSFDFLLQVTPVNADKAWAAFKRNRFEKAPLLRYRPLPIDPSMLKRALFNIPVERIEDPAVAALLGEKQAELDRELTMLQDRGTRRFLLGSLLLFGGVEDGLLGQAERVIETLPAAGPRDESGRYVSTEEFISRARREIAHYADRWEGFAAEVELRDDVISGLMVSRGNLLVARGYKAAASRVEPLLHHEIGTHLVTYYNGRAQRFRQLATGLAGYDALQEGLAVLAEYLSGGMSRPRLRLLAGRVIAANVLIEGGTFVDAFRLLLRYGFEQRIAFVVTLRVFRGGGLTKDVLYLRGLLEVLEYLKDGGALDPLYVGKIATSHIPLVRELQWRKVLADAPIEPRYLSEPRSAERLARLREGVELHDLVARRSK